MTKHMATELITGVNHFQSLIDKPIKLEISFKSSLRCSQHECKTESARIEAYFSLNTPLLHLTEVQWDKSDVPFNQNKDYQY